MKKIKFSIIMFILSVIAVSMGLGVFYWLSQFQPLPSSDISYQEEFDQ